MRIVSLAPSWTEYVVDLGCARELVGRTKFCVRAGAAAEQIPVIGGTKSIHLERIEQLKLDLVIASKEENTREDVEACRAFTDVLVTDVRTIPMLLKPSNPLVKRSSTLQLASPGAPTSKKHGESRAPSIHRHFTPSGKIRSWLPATTRTSMPR